MVDEDARRSAPSSPLVRVASGPAEVGKGAMAHVRGAIKRMLGSVLGDDDLRHEGALEQDAARLRRLGAAERRHAARRGEQAEVRIHEASLAAERSQLEAEETADAERRGIERREEQAEHRIDDAGAATRAIVAGRRDELHRAVSASEQAAAADRRRRLDKAEQLDRGADAAESRAVVIARGTATGGRARRDDR